jgi:hypothetical protein
MTEGTRARSSARIRADIGSGKAAFELMKANIREGWPGSPFPNEDEPARPNMVAGYYHTIGVSRVKADNGVWYWTVNYGFWNDPEAPMLSADGKASILRNGSFEDVGFQGHGFSDPQPVLGKGVWNKVTDWYPEIPHDEAVLHIDKTDYRAFGRWHVYAFGGGSITVLKDTAFFDDLTSTGAHGLRIVDSPTASAGATQLVKAVAGVNYEVSARSRRVAGTGPQALYLDFLNDKYDRIGVVSARGAALAGWSEEPTRVSATAPAGTAYARIILFATGDPGKGSTFDWDAVKLRAW